MKMIKVKKTRSLQDILREAGLESPVRGSIDSRALRFGGRLSVFHLDDRRGAHAMLVPMDEDNFYCFIEEAAE